MNTTPMHARSGYGAGVGIGGNDAVRATEACWALCAEGRYEAAAELMVADFVHDDRRRGLRNSLSGRDDTLANNREVIQMGLTPEFETLRLHGDELALVRAAFRDGRGNEVVALQVLATNGEGLRTCCVTFDDGDVDRATSEFDRRSSAAG